MIEANEEAFAGFWGCDCSVGVLTGTDDSTWASGLDRPKNEKLGGADGWGVIIGMFRNFFTAGRFSTEKMEVVYFNCKLIQKFSAV